MILEFDEWWLAAVYSNDDDHFMSNKTHAVRIDTAAGNYEQQIDKARGPLPWN